MARASQSVEAQHRKTLPELDWENVTKPGCYVDAASGDLFRIPQEAFVNGDSPALVRESRGASRLRQLSADPFLSSLKARLLCAQHNIEANF